jgi:NitT/TauT family transport system substrate-binding protein
LKPATAIVGTIAALIVVFFVLRSPSPTDDAVVLRPLRIAQTGEFFLYAGLYIALDTGTFKRRGLSVSITNTGGDEKSAAAVISGNAEIGIGDPTFAAIANARGQDLKVVSALVDGAPFWGVTFDKAVATRYSKAGLKDLRVATFPAPSTAFTLQEAMFKAENVPSNIVQGAFGSLQGILEAKKADIALELEPNVSAAQERGAIVLYSMAQKVGTLAVTGATVTSDYANKNPSIIRDFCGSLAEAYAYMRAHQSESGKLLGKRFKELSAPAIDAALKRMLAEKIIPETPRTDPKAWRAALQLRADVGDIKDIGAGEKALDNSYCDKASPGS